MPSKPFYHDPQQSTNHVLMIEPASFFANPQTMPTNPYQKDGGDSEKVTTKKAIKEFRSLQNALIENGVLVTAAKGLPDCPDMVFPNWFFTLEGERLMLCPMLNENRQAERSDDVVGILSKMYDEVIDWTDYEAFALALESTASIVSDRTNRQCYAALSPRTDEGLARKWATFMNYDIHFFNTQSHKDIPVYHTDCIMWIGTTLAGICSECIVESDRMRIVSQLSKSHDLVQFNNMQLQAFCGNALEVVGHDGGKMLVMSRRAHDALTKTQRSKCEDHFTKIIHVPLDTLEEYGGGSARCMLAELL